MRGGAANVDAEFVLAQAGGDVGMGLGEDVGIDAESEAGLELELCGARGEQIELGFALHVELENAGFERVVDLRRGFAHAGEDDAIDGFGRCGENALEFAAGDDVKSGAVLSQQLENGQRRIGFYGVADEVIAAGERVLKQVEALENLIGGVDVERRAVVAGEGLKRDAAAVERRARARMLERTGRARGCSRHSSEFTGDSGVGGVSGVGTFVVHSS